MDADATCPGPPRVYERSPDIPGLEPATGSAPAAAPPISSPVREPLIHFQGVNVNCLDLLNVICGQAKLEWTIKGYVLEIRPKPGRSPKSKEMLRKTLTRMLRAAVIPKLDLNGATGREAMEFWQVKCMQLDVPINVEKRWNVSDRSASPLAMFSENPDSGDTRIHFHGEKASCLDLLNEICRQTGMQWTVGEEAIIIEPLDRKTPIRRP